MDLSLPEDTLPPGMALGPVLIPGSKSVSNRALLLAASSPGRSVLRGGLEAEDTRWMREALRGLGFPLQEQGSTWTLEGGARPRAQAPLWLGASGTTLRFLLPWLALRAEGPVQLQGEERLFERPLDALLEPLQRLGARWEAGAGAEAHHSKAGPQGGAQEERRAPLPGGGWIHPCPEPPATVDLRIDARLSSQFLTGLALATATLPQGGILRWEATSSASYLELTVRWLRAFGCHSELTEKAWFIPGGQLQSVDLTLPGDWSGAAAFLGAAAVTGRSLQASPLDPDDPQGDRALPAFLNAAGCRHQWLEPGLLRLEGPLTEGLHANLEACPDLGPVLAAVAALAPQPSVLTGLHTLPLKECDRLEASADLVRWLGGRAEIEGDHTLRIWPGIPDAARPPFDPRNDHRMAFAAAVGALRWGGELKDAHCVAKTFPTFWEAWAAMLKGARK